MQNKEICVKCGAECCKRYWINILPFEAKRIAKHLRISLTDFIKKYCVFHLRVIDTGIKRIKLPSIALKKNFACVFLLNNKSCAVYKVRPEVCKFFPFLSLNENADLKKLYPFCLLLDFKKRKKTFNEKYYDKVKKYFSLIEKKGFQNVWPFIPLKGILNEKGKEKIISRKEFLEIIKS